MADPLTQRDQLLAELEATHAAEHEARLRVKFAEAEIERTSNARMDAYRAKARGHDVDGKAMAEAEDQWADATSALERFREQQDAARSARAAVENEIQALYVEHLADFAQEAERSTLVAAKALQELEAPLARVHECWAVAQAAWAPLAQAVSDTIRADEEEAGVWRDHSAALAGSRVPALPLPQPGFIAGLPPARPPGLRLPQEVSS